MEISLCVIGFISYITKLRTEGRESVLVPNIHYVCAHTLLMVCFFANNQSRPDIFTQRQLFAATTLLLIWYSFF